MNPVDNFLAQFDAQINAAFGLLGPTVFGLFDYLMAIGVGAMVFLLLIGGNTLWVPLARKAIYLGVIGWIVGNAPMLADAIADSFVSLGLMAGGNSLSVSEFMHPGIISNAGKAVAAPLLEQAGNMTGLRSTFENADQILMYLIAAFFVLLAYDILAIAVFVAIIAFKVGVIVAFVLAALAAWRGTAWAASGAFGFVLSSAVRLMAYALIASIISGMITSVATNPDPTVGEALDLVVMSLVILGLALFGGVIAGGVVTGAASMGLGAAMGTTVAGAAIAAAPVVAATRAGIAGGRMTGAAHARINAARTAQRPAGAAAIGRDAQAPAIAGNGATARAGGMPPGWEKIQPRHRRPELPRASNAIYFVRTVVPDGTDGGGGMSAPDLEKGS